MALLGNLLWFFLGGGIVSFFLWIFFGIIMAITVVGFPFAIAAFRIAGFAAFPFGKELVDARLVGESRILGTSLANFLWIVFAGLWLAISHTIAALMYFISIIGIPFGLAHLKLARVTFAPLGKKTISR